MQRPAPRRDLVGSSAMNAMPASSLFDLLAPSAPSAPFCPPQSDSNNHDSLFFFLVDVVSGVVQHSEAHIAKRGASRSSGNLCRSASGACANRAAAAAAGGGDGGVSDDDRR